MYRSWYALEIQYPNSHLLPKEEYLPESIPLVPVDTLAVEIEAQEFLMDGLINAINTLTI